MLCDNLGGLANFQEALTSESMSVAGAEFQSLTSFCLMATGTEHFMYIYLYII